DRTVYLLAPWGSYAPAQIAVADADGNVRTATIDHITVGTVFDEGETDPTSHTRGAGFAVDPDGGHAYVISPDLLVADVDLSTHETVALGFDGSQRYAVALGAREYFDVSGRYGYVCKDETLVRVLDAATGAQLAAPRGRTCAALADGRASDW